MNFQHFTPNPESSFIAQLALPKLSSAVNFSRQPASANCSCRPAYVNCSCFQWARNGLTLHCCQSTLKQSVKRNHQIRNPSRSGQSSLTIQYKPHEVFIEQFSFESEQRGFIYKCPDNAVTTGLAFNVTKGLSLFLPPSLYLSLSLPLSLHKRLYILCCR